MKQHVKLHAREALRRFFDDVPITQLCVILLQFYAVNGAPQKQAPGPNRTGPELFFAVVLVTCATSVVVSKNLGTLRLGNCDK